MLKVALWCVHLITLKNTFINLKFNPIKKRIFITGASSGIGLAIALHLHKKGYEVIGTSRTPEKYQLPFPLLKLDLSDDDSIASCTQQFIDEYGQLDVLINNAGVGITGALEELPKAEMLKNFQVNFFGPIQVIQQLLPLMRAKNDGLIINITSIAGYVGLPYRSIYSASKAALEIITESIRMEVNSFNIKVVNLAPGDFATNIAQNRYHAPLSNNSAYYEDYKKCLDNINKHVDSGNQPHDVAIAVEKIIQKRNPKIHNKVGSFIQKFSIVLKRILPDLWFEQLILKNQKN